MKLWPVRPATLFGRTAATLTAVLLAFQLVVLAVAVATVFLPMARRSADDLAALMVLSAQTWVELPPETRGDFVDELAKSHDLWLFKADAPLSDEGQFLPYLLLLERALTERVGMPIHVKITHWEKQWMWAEIPIGGQMIRIGFTLGRLGVHPLLALLLVMVAGVVLVPLTALVLARRIARPLARLADAAASVGEGLTPELLPESGPAELAALAATFNRMARQVKALMDNRTTLLAGISHDLRTPLARLRLGLAMMPENANPALTARMERDMEEMNRLIGGFLELAQGLGQEEKQAVDLAALLGDLAQGTALEWRAPPPCIREVAPVALRRLLTNLIENALRYGGGEPVSMALDCAEGWARIGVFDRGAGIPPDQAEEVFRPFYRLESSRSSATGGSGLGLAIARQLADANGWKIELLARPGGGTEARLTIPG